MRKQKWNESEVKSYLEFKVLDGISTDEEDELYIDMQYGNDLTDHKETINNLLEEMRDIFDNGYK